LKRLIKNTSVKEIESKSLNVSKIVIRPLLEKDVTSPYFIKWLFGKGQFEDDDPKDYNYKEVIYDDKLGNYSYGYFDGDKLEGTIRITYTDGEDFYGLSYLYVNPKKWNQGIGKKLINFVLKKYGNKKYVLNVLEKNKKAISIYTNYGFKITKLVKGDTEDDNYLVMEKMEVKQNDQINKIR